MGGDAALPKLLWHFLLLSQSIRPRTKERSTHGGVRWSRDSGKLCVAGGSRVSSQHRVAHHLLHRLVHVSERPRDNDRCVCVCVDRLSQGTVIRQTRHEMGHIGDALTSQSLG